MKQYPTGHDESGNRSEGPLSSVDRPRLVVVDNLELSMSMGLDPYLSLRALATYSGCSIRWLRDRLVDASHPLPCYRVEGKVLVRRSEFDVWIARFRSQGRPEVERLVGPALRELLGR
jgi:hypothetical protein